MAGYLHHSVTNCCNISKIYPPPPCPAFLKIFTWQWPEPNHYEDEAQALVI